MFKSNFFKNFKLNQFGARDRNNFLVLLYAYIVGLVGLIYIFRIYALDNRVSLTTIVSTLLTILIILRIKWYKKSVSFSHISYLAPLLIILGSFEVTYVLNAYSLSVFAENKLLLLASFMLVIMGLFSAKPRLRSMTLSAHFVIIMVNALFEWNYVKNNPITGLSQQTIVFSWLALLIMAGGLLVFSYNYRFYFASMLTNYQSTTRESNRQYRELKEFDRELRSEREKLSQEIEKREHFEGELMKINSELKESSVKKSAYFSYVSHEIRNPLSAILGFSKILLDEPHTEEQSHLLVALQTSGENLLRIVNDVLDYNKIESGNMEFESVKFNLLDYLNRLKLVYEPMTRAKGLSFELQVNESVPNWLHGDPTRLFQVINNLVSNAIKFTEKGTVSVRVKPNQVIDSNQVELLFEIEDTGIGISTENQKKLFKSFAQANATINRKYGGTGLGLVISKKIVELQGGTLNIRSFPGDGTCFYFNLKFNIIDKAEEVPIIAKRLYEKVDIENVKVLLVEDDAVNRLVISKFLKRWKIEYEYAENGVLAIEKVKSNYFDIVLMDIHMPEMDGFEATSHIRQLSDPKKNIVPIMAITASVNEDTIQKVYSSNMNGFISKPFNSDELLSRIIEHTTEYRKLLIQLISQS